MTTVVHDADRDEPTCQEYGFVVHEAQIGHGLRTRRRANSTSLTKVRAAKTSNPTCFLKRCDAHSPSFHRFRFDGPIQSQIDGQGCPQFTGEVVPRPVNRISSTRAPRRDGGLKPPVNTERTSRLVGIRGPVSVRPFRVSGRH